MNKMKIVSSIQRIKKLIKNQERMIVLHIQSLSSKYCKGLYKFEQKIKKNYRDMKGNIKKVIN